MRYQITQAVHVDVRIHGEEHVLDLTPGEHELNPVVAELLQAQGLAIALPADSITAIAHHPSSHQTKAELLAIAAERSIELPKKPTVAQIKEAIAEADLAVIAAEEAALAALTAGADDGTPGDGDPDIDPDTDGTTNTED